MRPDGKPTVRQVYALAAALCERAGEEFPETRDAASELIERLRTENGHPSPRLEDAPPRPQRMRHRRGRRQDERDVSQVAAELAASSSSARGGERPAPGEDVLERRL